MKRCTVFGGKGYIGGNLVNYLSLLGYDVSVPERKSLLGYESSLGHVFYCIGLTADFRHRPFDTVHAHVSVLSNILEFAQFDSLVFLSSTRLYQGASSSREEDDIRVNPSNASDIYNISKLMGESLCLSSGRKNVRVARLSNVVGRQDIASDNFLPTLYREAKTGKIALQSALSSEKDYIHIDDVVWLLEKITSNGTYSVYNVASGINIQHSQIVNILTEIFECNLEIIRNAPKIVFPEINIQRIKDEFCFEPREVLGFLRVQAMIDKELI